MQITITDRYHLILVIMTIIKKTRKISVGEDLKERELMHC